MTELPSIDPLPLEDDDMTQEKTEGDHRNALVTDRSVRKYLSNLPDPTQALGWVCEDEEGLYHVEWDGITNEWHYRRLKNALDTRVATMWLMVRGKKPPVFGQPASKG